LISGSRYSLNIEQFELILEESAEKLGLAFKYWIDSDLYLAGRARSMQAEKVDLIKLAQSLENRGELVVFRAEDLNVCVTSCVGEYPVHKHPKDEVFFVLEGELQLRFDGRKVVLRKGEGSKVPRETVHKPQRCYIRTNQVRTPKNRSTFNV